MYYISRNLAGRCQRYSAGVEKATFFLMVKERFRSLGDWNTRRLKLEGYVETTDPFRLFVSIVL